MELDDAYANGAYIPGADAYPPRWAARAEAFRAATRCEIDLPYGTSPREVFDLFHPDRLARGTLVFVHGGYWKAFDKSVWSHLAAGALARGWAVAMPSYDLCPEVRIRDITNQIRAALGVIAGRMPGPLRLTGHSAGGHLVARMLNPRVRSAWSDRVEAVVPISPLSDLAPLMRTTMNEVLRIDADEARSESPLHQPPPAVPVTVWVGGAERPAFLDQAKWLARAWDCGHVVVPERHHFDVIDALEDPDSALIETLLA